MSRCEETRDYGGVEVRCEDEAGHGGPHTPCPYCAAQIEEPFPTPGVRCTKHGTREPGATA